MVPSAGRGWLGPTFMGGMGECAMAAARKSDTLGGVREARVGCSGSPDFCCWEMDGKTVPLAPDEGG
eukprot:8705044-Alexandrium_andersonii.AAC.1